jgi:hypothetical protein
MYDLKMYDVRFMYDLVIFTIYKFTIYDLLTISRFAGFTIYAADNRQLFSIVHQSYLVNRQIVN